MSENQKAPIESKTPKPNTDAIKDEGLGSISGGKLADQNLDGVAGGKLSDDDLGGVSGGRAQQL